MYYKTQKNNMHLHVFIHIHTLAYICAHQYTHTHASARMQMYTHINACRHMYTLTHTHTHTSISLKEWSLVEALELGPVVEVTQVSLTTTQHDWYPWTQTPDLWIPVLYYIAQGTRPHQRKCQQNHIGPATSILK